MDINTYMDRIEQVVENPQQLQQLREQAAADPTLSDEDKRAIDGRIGTYLADQDRAEFGDEHTPETAPDEEGMG